MFEEFNHFFKEECFDLIVNNEVVLEAYSKKEENRIKKFLKENNFKEDNSSLTKEEIRKGYRRGTIETSIPDENGKKKRVDFEITPHPTGNKFSHGKSLSNKEFSRIQMNKKTLASKPRVSNFTFKHEEGHYAVYLDKKTGKYVIDLYKIKRLMEKHPELFSILNDHDSDPEEVFADRYALKNIPDKYKKQIISSKTDEAGNTIRSAQMSSIIKYYENETNRFIKRGPSSSYWHHKDQATDIAFKIKSIKTKMEVLKRKIDFHKDMIKTCESRISSNTRALDMVFNRELELIKKGYINNKFIDSLSKDINEYDKYIFMINNKIASLKETKEYYTQIKEQADKIQNSASTKKFNLEHDLKWKPWMTDEEKDKINKIINRINNSQTVKKANDECTEAINKIYSLDNQIKKLTDEWHKTMDEKHQLWRNQDRAKDSQRLVATINNQKNLIKKHIDEINREIKSYKKAILKDAEKMDTLKSSADSLSEAYMKHSAYMKYSPDVSKMSRDDVNKYMNKNIRKIEDNRDSTLMRQILAANSDEELENVINKYTQESFVDDDDDTSGTSDFDIHNDSEPDDCFCEAYDAITGEEIPIDHAYTMDEMKERTYTDDDLDKIRSKEELDAFYTKLKSKLGQGETIQEAKLPAKKRKELPDSDFALVYTDKRTGKKVRKYPVHDKEHVESAARMFPRGVPLKYQGEVARKILRRAHEFGIDTSGWKNLNRFKESD
jgi:hypothetical protein